MNDWLSPATRARVLPFVIFMVLLALRGQLEQWALPGIDARWAYGASVVLVTASLIWFARQYDELKLGPTVKDLALAGLVGFLVFELWIRLTQPWMMLGEATASFKPVDAQGQLIWSLVAVRWIGASLMVPVMEELFWRGFLMRWIDNPDFEKVDPRQVSVKAVVLSTVAFMLVHTQWLGAVVAGLAYAWLYRRTGKLWLAVVAHAVTNGVLGAWVVVYGNWQFW